MTNPPTDERREAFEKWAQSEWGYNLRRSDVNRNDYHYLSTQRSWQGWQAALSHQGEVVKVSDLQKVIDRWDNGQYGPGEVVQALRILTALISKAEKV